MKDLIKKVLTDKNARNTTLLSVVLVSTASIGWPWIP